MRRSLVEKALRALGWEPYKPSGKRHVLWRHPDLVYTIAVPTDDLILDPVGERLIDDASPPRRGR